MWLQGNVKQDSVNPTARASVLGPTMAAMENASKATVMVVARTVSVSRKLNRMIPCVEVAAESVTTVLLRAKAPAWLGLANALAVPQTVWVNAKVPTTTVGIPVRPMIVLGVVIPQARSA